MKMKLIIAVLMCLNLTTLTNYNSMQFFDANVSETEDIVENENFEILNNKNNDELTQYYLDNKIFPSSIPDGVGNKLFYDGVENHLISRFGGDNWNVSFSKDVSDVYGVNPIDAYEYDKDIQEAKYFAGIGSQYIGCGPLALFCQLDYLVHGPKYYELGCDIDSTFYR